MSLVLHAIGAARLADPPTGLRGVPVAWLPAGPLGAWASDVGEDALTRDDAFAHHRVIEELAARTACLPVRFPTRVAGAAGAATLLGERAAELAETLARVGTRREVALTLLWADTNASPGRGHAVENTGGRAYLERRRAAFADSAERRERAGALARRVEVELAVEEADVRHAICPSSEVAVSTAILARPGDEKRLKEEVVRVAARLEGVRAVVSGPWPPYTFAGAR